MNVVATVAFVSRRIAFVILTLLLFACRLHSAETRDATEVKLPVLKVGNEVYSNVTVTAVTATDIFFNYSRGMCNAKLERLDPELQKKFHFDPKKSREEEKQEQKVTANFHSWINKNRTNKAAAVQEETAPEFSLQASEATIENKYYDPIYDRPRNLRESGLARFDSDFKFDVEFTIHRVSQTNEGSFSFRIDTIKISIGLTMNVLQPASPTERLKRHLEGHRRIYEYFYAFGPKAAERAAEIVGNGSWMHPKEKDPASAEAWFLETAKSNAQMEYSRYTKNAAAYATSYYEDLTDYGTNLKDADQAVDEAIHHYEEQIPEGMSTAIPAIRVGGF